MEYSKPEKTAIKAWRLGRLITLLCIMLVLIAAIIVIVITDYDREFIGVGICAALGLLTLYKSIGLFAYPLIEYKQWKYLIMDEKIEIVHGIFFIKRDIIPAVRIQNITIKQGPIYRRYKLYTVEIALASGSFEIVGLSRETADEVAERMRRGLHIRLEQKEEA